MARALVCGDCRIALEALGATVDTTPRVLTVGTACEVHPNGIHAQAMHAIDAAPEVLRRFQVSSAETKPALEGPASDWQIVASLAATIAVGTDEPMSEALISQSVMYARRLVEASKGSEP